MGRHARIAILLHERDRYPAYKDYLIWALRDFWREEGFEVLVLKGPNAAVDADILIPHIDLTAIPDGYIKLFQHYPRVLNRTVHDISKRQISRNLLQRSDTYDGKVIVKTNLNYGGMPEARLNGTLPKRTRRSILSTLLGRNATPPEPDWARITCIRPSHYRVFTSLRDVPEAVFSNPSLVVERFCPEYENGLYYMRIYHFLGDRGYCVRLGGREPIVKGKTIVSRMDFPVPDEAEQIRRQLGLDYGKIDFVMHDGRVTLLDVNRTPGLIRPPKLMRERARRLGPGIHTLIGDEA